MHKRSEEEAAAEEEEQGEGEERDHNDESPTVLIDLLMCFVAWVGFVDAGPTNSILFCVISAV